MGFWNRSNLPPAPAPEATPVVIFVCRRYTEYRRPNGGGTFIVWNNEPHNLSGAERRKRRIARRQGRIYR